jgi:hypothetical protein
MLRQTLSFSQPLAVIRRSASCYAGNGFLVGAPSFSMLGAISGPGGIGLLFGAFSSSILGAISVSTAPGRLIACVSSTFF